jgi:hypothetical protein
MMLFKSFGTTCIHELFRKIKMQPNIIYLVVFRQLRGPLRIAHENHGTNGRYSTRSIASQRAVRFSH